MNKFQNLDHFYSHTTPSSIKTSVPVFCRLQIEIGIEVKGLFLRLILSKPSNLPSSDGILPVAISLLDSNKVVSSSNSLIWSGIAVILLLFNPSQLRFIKAPIWAGMAEIILLSNLIDVKFVRLDIPVSYTHLTLPTILLV